MHLGANEVADGGRMLIATNLARLLAVLAVTLLLLLVCAGPASGSSACL